jgi:hypothetical protein
MRNKYFIKEGNEELQKALLLMKYDSNKTLSENTILIKESSEDEYFNVRVRQILDYPEKIKEFKPIIGDLQNKAAKAIYNSVKGIGTSFEGVNYSIENGFKTLEELLGLSQKYKRTYGESLLSALSGEMFSSGESKIVNKGVELSKKFCNLPNRDKKYDNWCKVIDTKKLKYGF